MARGSALGLVGAVVSTIGGFAFVVVATRGLGAADSGRLFVAVALFTVLSNVGKLGTDTALVRFVARSLTHAHRPAEVRRLLGMASAATVASSLALGIGLVAAGRPVAALLYASPTEAEVLLVRLVGVFLPFGTLTLVMLAVTRGYGSVRTFVMVEQVVKPVLRPVLLGAICLLGGSVSDAMLAWLLPVLVGMLLAVRSLGATLPRRSEPIRASQGRGVTTREFWAFAAPRAVAGTLEIMAPWAGVLLLSALATASDASVYTAVTRVVTAGTMVLVAMRLALGPHVSAAFAREDQTHLNLLHQHSTTWSVLVSFPFFISIALFPDAVLGVFGASFDVGATALVVLVGANLVNVAVGNVQSVVLMGGRSSWNLWNTAAALVSQVVVGALLIPSRGVTGAAIGLGAGVVCNNVLSALQAHRGLGVRVWPRPVVCAIAATLAAMVPVEIAARATLGDSAWVLVGSALCGIVLLLAVVVARPQLFRLPEGWRVLTGDFGRTGTMA